MLFPRKYNITSEHKFLRGDGPMERKRACCCRPGRDYPAKRLPLIGGPALGLDVREHRVTHLDGFKFAQLVRRDLMSGFKAPPDVDQRAELFQVGIETFL